MNFKKTLGIVLTAAVISSSLVAVKPAKAAVGSVNASNAITLATAPTSSALTSFNYFFAERSLLVAGEPDTYVVDTNYSGSVQYELWVKSTTDPNGKWQVISADANGNPGYTAAVQGHCSPYSIPVVKGFTFAKGQYMTAVYAKVAGTVGAKTYGHYIDASGKDTDPKNGTEQRYDIVKTGTLNAVSSKGSYNEMLGDFIFTPDTFVVGQKVTFKGFQGQKDGARYKLVVRKYGTEASSQTVLNSTFASQVDWTPTAAGTYQVIAWSAPDVNSGAQRDGWRITTVTVKEKQTATVTSVAPIALTANQNDTKFALPKTVKATLSDGTTVDANVAWDTTVDVTKVGTTNITGKLTDYNNYAVNGTVTVVAPLTYVAGSLQPYNPVFSTVDLKVNDSSLVAKVLVDGKEAQFTAPDATTIRIKGLSDDPNTVTLVDKAGNQVVVKEADKTQLTYVAGSLQELNPVFGTVDLNVNKSSLVTKVLVDGKEAAFTTPDDTTIRIKGLSDDPNSVVLVDQNGNQVTVKAAAQPSQSKLTYVAGSLGEVNPVFGTADLTVNDSSLVAKVLVNGKEAKFGAPDATTIRIKGLSDDPTTVVLVDTDGNNVTVK